MRWVCGSRWISRIGAMGVIMGLENGDHKHDPTEQVLRCGARRHLRPSPSRPPRPFEGSGRACARESGGGYQHRPHAGQQRVCSSDSASGRSEASSGDLY